MTIELTNPDFSSNTREVNQLEAPFSYRSVVPKGCPFQPSEMFEAVEFTGRFRNYTNADTWYPSWAEDDAMYSPWTDGYLENPQRCLPFDPAHPGTACNSLDFMGRKAATAQARILGDDPMKLVIEDLPPRCENSPAPYKGRYPCASLCHEGVWYYGTYCVDDNPEGDKCAGAGWTEHGPFVGFRTSTDYGKTWQECPHTPAQSIFGENPRVAKVKFGTPHFVDFGKNMQYSPDGYAYLLAHGGTAPKAWNNWIQGDDIYLLRVKPSLETINDPNAYEFYAGGGSESPRWSGKLDDIQPLLSWPGRLGCVTATWHPHLNRYLMFITRGTSADSGDTMILESESLTGPWSLIQYLPNFGPFAYFINAPSKFIKPDSFWLCYSGNWWSKDLPPNPAGSYYSMSLHEIRLNE